MLKNKILGRKAISGFQEIKHSCTVRFLDDTEPITISFQKETSGQFLIDHVCTALDLAEKDFFGLRYVDSEKQRHWLEPQKPAYRQLKNVQPMVLCFRVKYYPSDPMKLKEEITRYFLYLQLERDLHHGRLLCTQAEANRLTAYMVQAELGDYNSEDHHDDYVSQLKMIPKQAQKHEDQIIELHKELAGQSPAVCESNFLKMASQMDTYGVDPHPVKDMAKNSMYLGITHQGIVTFQGNKRTHLFLWSQISRLDFEGKQFIVHALSVEDKENPTSAAKKKKQQVHIFRCPNMNACKHLWKCAVQQQYFFTLDSSDKAPKVKASTGLFRRSSTYRFSGHCESEVWANSSTIRREAPVVTRSISNPQFVRSRNSLGYDTLPASFKSSFTEDSIMTLESNRSMSIELENKICSIDEAVDEKIVEEASVEIFEQKYEPLHSPDREELPAFPPSSKEPNAHDSGIDADVSGRASPSLAAAAAGRPVEVDYSELLSADLDAQIKELQLELEKCKRATPPSQPHFDVDDHDDDDDVKTNFLSNGKLKKPTSIGEPVERKKSDDSNGNTLKVILAALLSLLILSIIIVVLLFETDVLGVRQWPELDNIRQHYYHPIKSTIGKYVPW